MNHESGEQKAIRLLDEILLMIERINNTLKEALEGKENKDESE